jgi:hypothetical protein
MGSVFLQCRATVLHQSNPIGLEIPQEPLYAGDPTPHITSADTPRKLTQLDGVQQLDRFDRCQWQEFISRWEQQCLQMQHTNTTRP